uniref:Cytochrome b5 n=1 Tax=Lygus hesperus TaxID=30085 RepID=A0A0A9YCV1_LYGHE
MVLVDRQEVLKHTKPNDCWIIIDNKVYNVSKFLHTHPGGSSVLLRAAGTDSSDEFHALHSDTVLAKYESMLLVGDLRTEKVEEDAHVGTKNHSTGVEGVTNMVQDRRKDFGITVPGSEPSWYLGWNSPYYDDTHIELRKRMREFVESEILPHVHTWDEMKKIPRSIHQRCYEAGWLPGILGTHSWP